MVDPRDFETAAERLRRISNLVEPASVRMIRDQQALIDRIMPTVSLARSMFSEPSIWDAVSEQDKFMRDVVGGSAVTLAAQAASMTATGKALGLASETVADKIARGSDPALDRIRAITESLSIAATGMTIPRTASQIALEGNLGGLSETIRAVMLGRSEIDTIGAALSSLSGSLNSRVMMDALEAANRTQSVGIPTHSDDGEIDPNEAEEIVGEWLLDVVQRFASNTKTEFQSVGVITVFMLWVALKSYHALLFPDDPYSPEERQADAEIAERLDDVAKLQNDLERAIDDVGSIAQERAEWISTLDRAIVISERAKVRELPLGNAKTLAQMPVGESVAIITKDGRWFYVVYEDQVTGFPTEGWIYETSIERLE